MERSWNVARPAPPPLPPGEIDVAFVTPHENESTSISSLCLSSIDSPLMSPSFAKMSDAIGVLLSTRRDTGAARGPARSWAAAGQCDALTLAIDDRARGRDPLDHGLGVDLLSLRVAAPIDDDHALGRDFRVDDDLQLQLRRVGG